MQSDKNSPRSTKKKRGLAITSLVLSIVGGYPWASTASIIAIICGHIALYKIKKHPNEYAGSGLAVAGLILGYLGLILAIILGIMRGIIKTQISF
ncbi:MAG: hypothetical protein CEN87_651 [Parcubacteria group bacterium Licking1014_1]|nr:MAG: hypothetical protein CEN87_651 [Parcubacteria group bacterium Licking1014_1]